ncbi:MAG: hypothetical protein IKH04_04950 [Kiritimatiellae bacterium]|nr:hypothetical protein [Kiritimatiellia bacterium]
MDVNEHYSVLLGVGEECEVSKVELDVEGRRVDIFVEYAKKAAVCPECCEVCIKGHTIY